VLISGCVTGGVADNHGIKLLGIFHGLIRLVTRAVKALRQSLGGFEPRVCHGNQFGCVAVFKSLRVTL